MPRSRDVREVVVRTIEDEDAHPLYLSYMRLRSSLLSLAVVLSRSGYRSAGLAIANNLPPLDLPGLPKVRSTNGGV